MVARLRRYQRRMWRTELREQSLLSLDEVIEGLPGQPHEARTWLKKHVEPFGQIVNGLDMYLWGDVLRAIGSTRRVRQVSAENSRIRVQTDSRTTTTVARARYDRQATTGEHPPGDARPVPSP